MSGVGMVGNDGDGDEDGWESVNPKKHQIYDKDVREKQKKEEGVRVFMDLQTIAFDNNLNVDREDFRSVLLQSINDSLNREKPGQNYYLSGGVAYILAVEGEKPEYYAELKKALRKNNIKLNVYYERHLYCWACKEIRSNSGQWESKRRLLELIMLQDVCLYAKDLKNDFEKDKKKDKTPMSGIMIISNDYFFYSTLANDLEKRKRGFKVFKSVPAGLLRIPMFKPLKPRTRASRVTT